MVGSARKPLLHSFPQKAFVLRLAAVVRLVKSLSGLYP